VTSDVLPAQPASLSQTAVRRAQRTFGLIVLPPALVLPIYQRFLHGGRDAASILPHADAGRPARTTRKRAASANPAAIT
jgi:hypothetical protein